MKKSIRALLLAAVTALTASCASEPKIATGVQPDGSTTIKITMNTPTGFISGATPASTRDLTFNQENTVADGDLYVLIFDNSGGLSNILPGVNLVSTPDQNYNQGNLTSGTATFSVTLPPNMANDKTNLVILANCKALLDATIGSTMSDAQKGKTRDQVLAAVTGTITDALYKNGGFVPMFAETGPFTVNATTSQQTVELMRAVARIDVGVGQMSFAQSDKSYSWNGKDASGKDIPFKLQSVTVIRPENTYTAAPASANYTGRIATAPTVPGSSTKFSQDDSKSKFHYDANANGALTRAIYVPESNVIMNDTGLAGDANHMNRMTVVVGGYYGTDTQITYYRVDFVPSGSSKQLVNVLRNHVYFFNLQGVASPGHSSIDEAVASQPVNITANVVAWNDSSMNDIMSSGTNFLAVERNNLALYNNSYTGASRMRDNVDAIQTSYPGGWSVDKIVDAKDSVTVINWITGVSPSSGGANTKTNLVINAQQNTGTAARSALVWIKAGNMNYPIKVTQGVSQMPTTLDLTNGTAVVPELAFTTAVGVKPAAQTLRILWSPNDRPLSVATARGPNGDTDFASGSGQPANGETIPAGGGTKDYTISPPAITAAEYANNPFILKSTKVDVTLDDGTGSVVTKSIMLRQMIPTVTASPAAYYLVNGSTYTFSVRSNVPWVIKAINEKQNATYVDRSNTSILANKASDNLRVGLAMGPNSSTTGDVISFTTAAQIGKWGTVDVVISSPDTPAKFADKTVTLVLATPTIKAYTISAASNGEGAYQYNILDSTQPGGPFYMLTDTRNYGTTATSTVIMEPFQSNGRLYNRTDGTNTTLTTANIQNAIDYGADILTISGAIQWGDDVSVMIKRFFLDNNKPVWVNIQEINTLVSMINTTFGQSWVNSVPILYNNAYESNPGATYHFLSDAQAQDPVMVGPFGDLRGKYWGEHWTGSHGVFDLPTNVSTRFSNAINGSGNTTSSGSDNTRQYNAFRLKQVPLVWIADDGFTRADQPSGTNVSPFYINSNNYPAPKTYGGSSPQQQIYNSAMLANFMAWCAARNPAK